MKSSAWILEQAQKHRLLEPFVSHSVRDGVISYGLGPYGYDIRLHDTYKIPRATAPVIDPHTVDLSDYETKTGEKILLPAGSCLLGRSVEYVRMPAEILGLVFGKSTYARCGILVNVTPLEPEWSGFITLSISNVSERDVVLHPDQGIAQILFIEGETPPLFSYKQLGGKYDEQSDILPSKIQ